MKSYQFFTDDDRGGTMLCDDDTLELAVSELTKRFKGVVRVQIGKEVWTADDDSSDSVAEPANTASSADESS
ncbi:MAG: hypothetical protein OQK12_03585 [Motiliproteus sp.]|nr:hypothetical protein [Motiliproteus sp.]MCW9053036.1 hypothetical protein [Motiliproteus sp.]